jgi:hypothetical protein
MKVGITLSIDMTKIDESRLYKGMKGTYLDLTTFVDTETKDKYENNGFITQSQTKEEREGVVNVSLYWEMLRYSLRMQWVCQHKAHHRKRKKCLTKTYHSSIN